MAEDTVPDELARFVSEHIESYEELELLRWVDAHRHVELEVSSVAGSLGIPESILDEALAALVLAGVLVRAHASHGVCYEPATAEMGAKIRALTEYYERNRLQVVRLMTENSMRRLRGSALQAFADCFLLGKPGKRG